MSKRIATNELNHDNWGDEEEPEEAGTFQRASADDIKKRQIRTARRRGAAPPAGDVSKDPEEQAAPTSVFAGFSGFKKTEPASAKSLFSFLSATPNGSSVSKVSASSPVSSGSAIVGDDKDKKVINGLDGTSESSIQTNNDKEYFRKLRGLNESVSRWISTHVAKNPLCILTPVFSDYEKHLAAIQSSHSKDDGKLPEITSSLESSKSVNDNKLDPVPKDVDQSNVSSKSDTGKDDKKTFTSSLFGSTGSNTPPSSTGFSFGSSAPVSQASPQFCFGSSSTSDTSNTPTFSFGTGGSTYPSAGFSFGAGKPFMFPNVENSNVKTEQDDNDAEDEDTPPKPDHKPINEEGAVYTKRCKVFFKQDKAYSDRGIGNLFLKPVDGGKTQLIVRADTSLGNVLLNFLLNPSLPLQRLGTNNVAVVCFPTPEALEKQTPVTVLLRVKTSVDADELLDTLEKHKKAV